MHGQLDLQMEVQPESQHGSSPRDGVLHVCRATLSTGAAALIQLKQKLELQLLGQSDGLAC